MPREFGGAQRVVAGGESGRARIAFPRGGVTSRLRSRLKRPTLRQHPALATHAEIPVAEEPVATDAHESAAPAPPDDRVVIVFGAGVLLSVVLGVLAVLAFRGSADEPKVPELAAPRPVELSEPVPELLPTPGKGVESVAMTTGATSFVVPGSRVDVVAAVTTGDKLEAFVLVTDLLVVRVESVAAPGEAEHAPTVTFEVAEEEASLIALARRKGCGLELILRSPQKAADAEYDARRVKGMLDRLPAAAPK